MALAINVARVETCSLCCYVPPVFRLVLVMLLSAAAACTVAPTDQTPAGALSLFLEAMGEAEDDPSARARAYALMATETRRALVARARLASALSARPFQPWEMIVEGRYRLRFRPREHRGFEERIAGDRAIVVVRGDGRRERAEVPMVREGGKWRVYLHVPAATREGAATSPRPDAGASAHQAH